ncbi:response regulator [Blautia liquoris]|uniref:Stage 0 sporulation protein A homolog n=1 Tax=Blautia liquoris TaxID=2779518 RepID=A0A7M2RIT7_9FIRM|nr:response regulator [Blautia liquoris]QOV20243.1 response regulator [Blautia liquoris]
MYRVVVVDDEAFVIEGFRAVIDWSGFNCELVKSATDPFDALDYIEKHSVDILITDISMPQMDGIELIKKAHESNPVLSILVLSAYDNFEYVRSAMRNGAENYLLKPLDQNELAESLSQIVSHMKERTALSDTYGSSMLTFRSNFIEEWVKGTLDEDDFITRAQMLGVNLYLDNYTVIIFTVPTNLSSGNEKMSMLFDFMLKLIIKTYVAHFYFETPSCLVCVISSNKDSDTINKFVEKINKARIIFDFPFFTSVGNTVDNYEDVTLSFRNASKFLYLKDTALTSIICYAHKLAPSTINVIEQEFTSISKEDYLEQISRLFWENNTGHYYSMLLEILYWGTAKTNSPKQTEPEIVNLLRSMKFNFGSVEDYLEIIASFIDICYKIIRTRENHQNLSFPCVDAVITAVHDFSDKDISLKSLAARMNMNSSYLGSIFHQQTGYYFNDYLNEERLKYAADLIKNSDEKLKDIVNKSGFSSQTYFNRKFKAKFGLSPNTYRREYKIENLK